MDKKECLLISLVTTCKGRLHYLQKSLPSWLKQDYPDFEVVVVDFDCPQKTAEYIESNRQNLLKNSRAVDLRVVRVFPRPFFNLNEARNIGCNNARGSIIFLIDADVTISRKTLLKEVSRLVLSGKEFISSVLVLPSFFKESQNYYRYYFNNLEFNGVMLTPFSAVDHNLAGTVVITKERYLRVGGYREEINRSGWGWDDLEFYLRYLNYNLLNVDKSSFMKTLLKQIKTIGVFPENAFKSYPNSEEEKSCFYPDKKAVSKLANQHFLQETIIELEKLLPQINVIECRHSKKDFLLEHFRGWLYWRIAHGAYLKSASLIAEEYFQKLTRIDDYCGRAYYFLGRLRPHKREHYLLRAINFLKKKAKKDDYDFLCLALTLKELGISEEAAGHFRRLFKSTKKVSIKASVAFHLSEIMIFKQKINLARKYLQFVLAVNPQHIKAAQYLEEIKERRCKSE